MGRRAGSAAHCRRKASCGGWMLPVELSIPAQAGSAHRFKIVRPQNTGQNRGAINGPVGGLYDTFIFPVAGVGSLPMKESPPRSLRQYENISSLVPTVLQDTSVRSPILILAWEIIQWLYVVFLTNVPRSRHGCC